jgi:hypothetical protein
MSTIARTASGTPVASTDDRRPAGPAQSRARARRPRRRRSRRALGAHLAAQLEPRSWRSTISTSAPRSRARRHTHWPIGPAPSTTTRSPGSIAARSARRARRSRRLGHRRDGGVVGRDREDLLLADVDSSWLQAAVDVDPDQLEVVARVRAPDAARVAVPAGVQRPQRHALADARARAAARRQAR